MRLGRFHPVDLVLRDPVRIVDEAARIGQRQHLAAELDDLFGGVRRDIARTRNDGGLADQILPLCGEHIGEEVNRSEEHTSELQSLMRISYAVFCLKKKKKYKNQKKKKSHKLV